MADAKAVVLAGRRALVWRARNRFFGDQFGLVISDLAFERVFDYEFVYEDLNFFHFRLSGASLESPSPGFGVAVVDRQGFMLTAAPNGHVEKSRKLATAPRRSVTPFFDEEAIGRVIGDDGSSVANVAAFLRDWRVREGRP